MPSIAGMTPDTKFLAEISRHNCAWRSAQIIFIEQNSDGKHHCSPMPHVAYDNFLDDDIINLRCECPSVTI